MILAIHTHYDTHPISSVKTQDFRHLNFLSIITYINVHNANADNARDVVLLLVSATRERK
jgi:hypothetical protein